MDVLPIGLPLTPWVGKGVLEGMPAGPLAVGAGNFPLVGHAVDDHTVHAGGPVAVEGANRLLPVQLVAAHQVGQHLVRDELVPRHVDAAGDVAEVFPHFTEAKAFPLGNVQHTGGGGGVYVTAVGLGTILAAEGVRPVLKPLHMIPEI